MVGSCKYSLATVFSLHPVKSITSGEGGIITTNNFRFYKKLLRLRSHGITKDPKIFINKLLSKTEGSLNSWYSEMQDLGFHYRITDFQCALAISQLKKLKAFIKKRRLLAKRYDLAFKNSTNISLIQQDYRKISSHHLYVISVNFKKMKINKAKFVKELMKKNIITQVHYMPIFLHPFYANKKTTTRNNIRTHYNIMKIL